jgi:hypothetical protein
MRRLSMPDAGQKRRDSFVSFQSTADVAGAARPDTRRYLVDERDPDGVRSRGTTPESSTNGSPPVMMQPVLLFFG